MKFNVFVPTRIISGAGCVKENAEKLVLGKKAYIVTGKSGAKKSGALDDVTDILKKFDVEFKLFDGCCENPRLLDCFSAGKDAREFGADFVIGIGGGSALDSAKAIAFFAANPELSPMDVYSADIKKNDPLPLAAIPTTSGTGSEANGVSVMTLPDGVSKKSFGGENSWPRVAFLDPAYTASLGYKYTVSCALDAFSHAMESYLCHKSTEFSRILAVFAAKNIWNIIKNGKEEFDLADREALQNASCAAGIAISVTGTGFPHPLGYAITMLDGIPHGAACAVFYGAYIKYNMRSETGRELIEAFCREIGAEADELAHVIPELSGVKLSLDEDEIEKRVSLIAGAKNYLNSPYVINDGEKLAIYRELFLK